VKRQNYNAAKVLAANEDRRASDMPRQCDFGALGGHIVRFRDEREAAKVWTLFE
jgi:hypothetical protein